MIVLDVENVIIKINEIIIIIFFENENILVDIIIKIEVIEERRIKVKDRESIINILFNVWRSIILL